MCELLAMSSRFPATVRLSFEQLAAHGGCSGPHVDGWGVGFYDDYDAFVLREPAPACYSAQAKWLREQQVRSQIVIAHIRKATQGVRALKNTQPFTRELAGRIHTFAHNGNLPGIHAHPEFGLGRFRPVGDTDSEHAFCALLGHMALLWQDEVPPSLDARLRLVSDFAGQLAQRGQANFLYSDGEALFAHGNQRHQPDGQVRAPGLHMLRRHCAHPQPPTGGPEFTMASEFADQEVILFASVPLSDEAWRPLAEGEVVMAVQGGVVPGQRQGQAQPPPHPAKVESSS